MPVNITEEFVHQLMAQIDFLTKQNSTLTATIAELNQTIKELCISSQILLRLLLPVQFLPLHLLCRPYTQTFTTPFSCLISIFLPPRCFMIASTCKYAGSITTLPVRN